MKKVDATKKDTESQESNPAEEAPEKLEEDTSAKLSTRDALEVALLGTKPEPETAEKAEEEPKPEPEKPKYEAPAEWTAEEKADFLELSTKQQEAALRLRGAAVRQVEEIRRGRQELAHLQRLQQSIEPFIKALGTKYAPDVAIQKALAMWNEFETGDPRAKAVEYLKAKGIPVPQDLLEGVDAKNVPHEAISPLQERLNSLEQKIAEKDSNERGQMLLSELETFQKAINAAGKSKYPDFNDTESGRRIASSMGDLVRGDTELSKHFIRRTQERIPNLTYQTLLDEAYRISGGTVDDSQSARTQDAQKHLVQSSRAASSKPGRVASSANSTPVKKLSRREALAAAVAEIEEREGA